MSKSTKFGGIGAVIGAVAAATNANPLTVADLALGAVITGAIGYFMGRWSEKNNRD